VNEPVTVLLVGMHVWTFILHVYYTELLKPTLVYNVVIKSFFIRRTVITIIFDQSSVHQFFICRAHIIRKYSEAHLDAGLLTVSISVEVYAVSLLRFWIIGININIHNS
jgi:hypothetical protein